jgi:hypothetical protein
MLAKRRSIMLNGNEISRTPLLVPSFSSKGFPDVAKILRTSADFVEGPMLVSAYDLFYEKIRPPFDFASLIFLDSGGYEASKDADLSDFGDREHKPVQWSQVMHDQILSKWHQHVPTVLISYDHPRERLPIRKQIDRAKRLKQPPGQILREILLKPETKSQKLVKVESITERVRALDEFDVIGVTEKEIGNSILERMENIAKIRIALDKAGMEKPIHVFGSLDTVTTPMYFLAGADIFDGLTWLRFAYREGNTIYKHNYGALNLGIRQKSYMVDVRCWYDNYAYLREMELEMRRFLNNSDFRIFKYHRDDFRKAYETLAEAVENSHGR